MDHYLDIRILPDPEFSTSVLTDALFAKLHRALTQAGDGKIGISFPLAGKTPGELLRLHGTLPALSQLEQLIWRKGLTDYTSVSDIQAVPPVTKYRTVQRVQVKSSRERLLRRSVKKGWITEEEARIKLADVTEKHSQLPFIRVNSLSSGQTFLLFIHQGPLTNSPVDGVFSAYGLSAEATIPWF